MSTIYEFQCCTCLELVSFNFSDNDFDLDEDLDNSDDNKNTGE